MRPKTTFTLPPSPPLLTAGTIILYNTDTDDLEYCTADEYSATTDNHTDVGVVAVPNNCTPDKSVRLVSVPFMSMNTPDIGIVVVGPDSVAGGEQEFLHFGEKNIKSKKECAEIPTWDNRAESPSYSTSSSGYLSTDVNSGKTQNTEGPKSYYYDSPFVVPPYDENEELVKEYSTGSFGDFDGKKNTEVILEMATGQTDWKTDSAITNSSSEGYYPAAECCWRFHTAGTSQGDWYLPSLGELGFLFSRLKMINSSLSTIKGNGAKIDEPSDLTFFRTKHLLWASTPVSDNAAFAIHYYGLVKTYDPSETMATKAFLSLDVSVLKKWTA